MLGPVRIKAFIDPDIPAPADGFDGASYRRRRVLNDLPRGLLRGPHQRIARHDKVDQAMAQGFGRGNRLAGHHHFQCAPHAHQACEALGSAESRNQSELDLGLAEHGAFRGDAKRARHREFASAAERKSIDCGNRRLLQQRDRLKRGLPGERVRFPALCRESLNLPDVRSRRKRLVAGTRQNGHADGIVVPDPSGRALEFGKRLDIQRVPHRGTIDGQDRHTVTHPV
jgi:hypothetical protein